MRHPVRSLFLASARLHPNTVACPAGFPLSRRATEQVTCRCELAVETWEEAAQVAMRVEQEPLFLHFVERHCPDAPLRPETRAGLESQSKYHAFRWAEIRESVESLLAACAAKGVRPLFLKGIACAGEYYDPPHLRPMRDIDILAREDDIDAIRAAAEACGFHPGESPGACGDYDGHHHLAPIFHGVTGICLEIHHHLMHPAEEPKGFPPPSEFWSGARDSTVFPGRALTLQPELAILLICAHGTRANSIGRRSQSLIDLVRMIETHGHSLDWQRLLGYARSPDVARSLAVPLLYLAGEGLPTAPEPCLKALRHASGLKRWEIALLFALTNRYRIGAPPPWRLVSGRISNILWRQALRRRCVVPKAFAATREILARNS